MRKILSFAKLHFEKTQKKIQTAAFGSIPHSHSGVLPFVISTWLARCNQTLVVVPLFSIKHFCFVFKTLWYLKILMIFTKRLVLIFTFLIGDG